jgi:hypothetical protein
MSESGTDFIPLNNAALQLDTTENGIIMLIESGELHGKKIDEKWYVDQSSLNAYDKSKAAIKSEGCGICGSSCGNGC